MYAEKVYLWIHMSIKRSSLCQRYGLFNYTRKTFEFQKMHKLVSDILKELI